jgi:gas vesicle protein
MMMAAETLFNKSTPFLSFSNPSRYVAILTLAGLLAACDEQENQRRVPVTTASSQGGITTQQMLDRATTESAEGRALERDKLASAERQAVNNFEAQNYRAEQQRIGQETAAIASADAQKTAAMYGVAGTLGGAAMGATPAILNARNQSKQLEEVRAERKAQDLRGEINEIQKELQLAEDRVALFERLEAGESRFSDEADLDKALSEAVRSDVISQNEYNSIRPKLLSKTGEGPNRRLTYKTGGFDSMREEFSGAGKQAIQYRDEQRRILEEHQAQLGGPDDPDSSPVRPSFDFDGDEGAPVASSGYYCETLTGEASGSESCDPFIRAINSISKGLAAENVSPENVKNEIAKLDVFAERLINLSKNEDPTIPPVNEENSKQLAKTAAAIKAEVQRLEKLKLEDLKDDPLLKRDNYLQALIEKHKSAVTASESENVASAAGGGGNILDYMAAQAGALTMVAQVSAFGSNVDTGINTAGPEMQNSSPQGTSGPKWSIEDQYRTSPKPAGVN